MSSNNTVNKNSTQSRMDSVDSAAFFEAQDKYDDYDDFDATTGNAVGQTVRRPDHQRGPAPGNVYSNKHVRAKEAQRQNGKAKK